MTVRHPLFPLAMLALAGVSTAQAAPPEPRLIDGCVDPTGFKDPAVILLPPGWIDDVTSSTLLLMGDYGARRTRGFVLDVANARLDREVAIELPPVPEGHMRWAPMAALEDDRLWLAATRGRVDRRGIDWPTFRLVLARADRVEATADRLVFRDERVVELPTPAGLEEVASRGGLAFIDPELWREADGAWRLYYVVVAHGMAGVRPHEEWLRRCRFETLEPDETSTIDTLVAAGIAGSVYDGVVEAPSVSPILNRQEQLVISSGPSDNGQRIGIVPDDGTPSGRPSDPPRWLLSTRPDDHPWRLAGVPWERDGVGGQAVFELDGVVWLVYQGLGTRPSVDERRAFRPALLDITSALIRPEAAPDHDPETRPPGLHPD